MRILSKLSRFVFLIFLFSLPLLSMAKIIDEKGYSIRLNPDGTYTLKVYLNFYERQKKVLRLKGTHDVFDFYFPIPDRFIPLSVNLHLTFFASPVLNPKRSFMDIKLNGIDIKTILYKDIKKYPYSVDVKLPIQYLVPHNHLYIETFQHYSLLPCENPGSKELWTDLFLNDSYLEIQYTYKIIPNTLKSISQYILDPKNIYQNNINIVIDYKDLNSESFKALTLLINSLAKIYRYNDMNISISDKPVATGDNYILGTKDFVYKILGYYPSGQILITDNNLNPIFKDIIISGQDYKDIIKSLLKLFVIKLNLFKESSLQQIDISKVKPLKPYSAPGFLPMGQKVYFKDLGFKTTTLKGSNTKAILLPYKIYPDVLFGDKDKIYLHLIGNFPKVVRPDSVINFYAQNIFLLQIPLKENPNDKDFGFYANTLPKGSGNFKLEAALIPFRQDICSSFNTKNLVMTISDKSYIEFPDAVHITEMPYIEFFASTAYPYSIYGDLQDTTLILTSLNKDVIEAALKVLYFMSQRIQYPFFFIKVYTPNDGTPPKNELKKNLIIIGPYNEQYKDLFSQGAVKIVAPGKVEFNLPLFWEFRKKLPVIGKEYVKQMGRVISIFERYEGDMYTFVQMFENPYKDGKTVLEIYSENPKELKKFVNEAFSLAGSYILKGDLVVYLPDKDYAEYFNVNKKYVTGYVSPIFKIKFELAKNPVKYFAIVVVVSLVIVVSLVMLLEAFRRKHHPDAEK